jgi:hypothetical protein
MTIIVRKKRLYLTEHECGLHLHIFIVDMDELSFVVSFHSNTSPSTIIVVLSYGPVQTHS